VIRALPLVLAALCAAGPAAGASPLPRRGTARAAAPEASQPASAEPVRHGTDVGAVVHVTAARAYLDAGAAHGLAQGQALRLLRGGAFAATCEVETVAPRHATCRPGGAARRGDLFRVAPPAPPAPPKPLARLVAAEELDRRAAELAGQPHLKVEARAAAAAPPSAPSAGRVEAAFAHASWWSSGVKAWQEERVDAAIRGAEVWRGVTLHADLRAVRWTARPDDARDRSGGASRLYVWEAALAQRGGGRAWTAAAGRVLPWSVPGATVLDGVQLGLAPSGERGEVGIFGGFVPDPATLSPTTDRSTAGAYASVDLGGGALVARGDARAAVTASPELGTRFEGDLRSVLLLGRRVNAEGNLRLGIGGEHQAQHGVDLAQVDLAGRPLPHLAVSGLFRYAGLSVPDAAAPAIWPGHERRWDASAGYELGPALVSAAGGWGRDLDGGLERWWVGPEVAFARLFGARGGLTLGYAEERGWIEGRTAWAQAALRASSRLRVSGRLSWTEDLRDGATADHALGVLLGITADLGRWVSLRASLHGRAGAQSSGAELGSQATGFGGRVGIASRF
jgi:hypothetical protein